MSNFLLCRTFEVSGTGEPPPCRHLYSIRLSTQVLVALGFQVVCTPGIKTRKGLVLGAENGVFEGAKPCNAPVLIAPVSRSDAQKILQPAMNQTDINCTGISFVQQICWVILKSGGDNS